MNPLFQAFSNKIKVNQTQAASQENHQDTPTENSALLRPKISRQVLDLWAAPSSSVSLRLIQTDDAHLKCAKLMAAFASHPNVNHFFNDVDANHFNEHLNAFLNHCQGDEVLTFDIVCENFGLNKVLRVEGQRDFFEYASGALFSGELASGKRDWIKALDRMEVVDGKVQYQEEDFRPEALKSQFGDEYNKIEWANQINRVTESGKRAYIPQLDKLCLVQGKKVIETKQGRMSFDGGWKYDSNQNAMVFDHGTIEVSEDYLAHLDYKSKEKYFPILKGMTQHQYQQTNHWSYGGIEFLQMNEPYKAVGQWSSDTQGKLLLSQGTIDFANRVYEGSWQKADNPRTAESCTFFKGTLIHPDRTVEKGTFTQPGSRLKTFGNLNALLKYRLTVEELGTYYRYRDKGERERYKAKKSSAKDNYQLVDGERSLQGKRFEKGVFSRPDVNENINCPTYLSQGLLIDEKGNQSEGDFAYIGDRIQDVRLVKGVKTLADGSIEKGLRAYIPALNDTKLILGEYITPEGKSFKGEWKFEPVNQEMLFFPSKRYDKSQPLQE